MATPKTSLRTVINQVTKEKLAWLDCQRQKLRAHFQPILEKYENPENRTSLQFLREIHAALKSCTDSENPALDKTKDLTVLLNWIKLDDPDEVIFFGSEHLVRHWIDVLVRKIKFQIERCEYSCLYANVMTQYMDVNSSQGEPVEMMEVETSGAGIDEKTDKEKTIQEFTERIFREPSKEEFDLQTFDSFLNDKLFNMEDPIQKDALLKTRKCIREFSKGFHLNNTLNSADVSLTIDGLLAEDLLGSEKAVTLKELKENDDALNEVATLLTNRLQNFAHWQWPESVYVDFRRNMAGRYRAYMDEDIITAIFLHYVGAQWSIKFKQLYKGIYFSKMWKRGTGTKGDFYYRPNSVEGYRREFHGQSFLAILPTRMQDLASTGYDDDNRSRKRSNAELTPMAVKQKLLHFISNEIQLNQLLRPEVPLTVVQTDMEWFGPSIVHDAIYAIMKFFGVTDQWLCFFRKFLECPLRVGTPGSSVQVRKRGVPMSHMLSTLFGESLLFVMDLYVNQQSGLSLYRIHDDFWFWGHDQSKVAKAWVGIHEFVKISGLKMNEEKSASVECQFSGDAEKSSKAYQFGGAPLPQRKVKWGFLELHSDGVFRVSQELLEPHVLEMKKYLQEQESVLGWVHCHNRYMKFFIRNFAELAIIFGKQHIVQIMRALQGILKLVHDEAKGDTVEALKLKFAEIWKDKEVMDSWVHWPVEEGGLSLFNPFLDLIPLHEAYRKKEQRMEEAGHNNKFGEAIDKDKTEWTGLLDESKKRRKRRAFDDEEEGAGDEESITDADASGSEDEYEELFRDEPRSLSKSKKGKKAANVNWSKRVNYQAWVDRSRETRWQRWRNVYCELLGEIEPESTQDSVEWKQCLYSSQLEEKLGDDSGFINTNLIPLSLISSMQASRVHKN